MRTAVVLLTLALLAAPVASAGGPPDVGTTLEDKAEAVSDCAQSLAYPYENPAMLAVAVALYVVCVAAA